MLVGWLARIAKAFGVNRGDDETYLEAEAAQGRSLLGSMISGLVPSRQERRRIERRSRECNH